MSLIFVQSAQFKLYTQYINNYDNSVKTVVEMKAKEPRFESFLQYQSGLLTGSFAGLSLDSFLILPIQRLPRYELLLRDITQRTWVEHQDYNSLLDASKSINGITSFLNESKRVRERMDELLQVQQKFSNLTESLLQPHRKFIKQGCLTLLEQHKEIGKIQLFLFTDMLMGAEEKPKTFSAPAHYEQLWTIRFDKNFDIAAIGRYFTVDLSI